MNRSMLIIGAAVLGMALLAAVGCGSSTNGGVGADEGSDPTFAFHGRPGHRLDGEGGLPAWVCDQ